MIDASSQLILVKLGIAVSIILQMLVSVHMGKLHIYALQMRLEEYIAA